MLTHPHIQHFSVFLLYHLLDTPFIFFDFPFIIVLINFSTSLMFCLLFTHCIIYAWTHTIAHKRTNTYAIYSVAIWRPLTFFDVRHRYSLARTRCSCQLLLSKWQQYAIGISLYRAVKTNCIINIRWLFDNCISCKRNAN